MASRHKVKVRTRTKKKTGRKHDMKYSCFRRSGGDLTALYIEALLFGDGAINMLLKLLELLDSTQTPSAGLVDCVGKGKLDFEGNQHVVSTCFKADVAASLEVQQQWKTSTRKQYHVLTRLKKSGASSISRIGASTNYP
ncbi:hypothetical protein FF2_002939 [Malus domestica]